jgi:uncharacterized membrane protein YphA (DoxX/SURF4 family)
MALGIEERSSLAWIGLLRIISGGLLVLAGIEKIRSHFRGPALTSVLESWSSAGKTFGFAKELLATYVQPRIGDVAAAVVTGELVAGVSLFFGLASRVGALIALLLNVSYFLASRETINLLMAVIDLAVLVSGGGRALGFDGMIRKSSPRWFVG